jgi:C_GCAxxG_C_C family probable redox protein
MDNRVKIAKEKFESGYNCAQSVFLACLDEKQISKNTALKIATGFGAGYGRIQEVCGAVSGAIMTMGLKNGRSENEDRNAAEAMYQKTRDFIKSFEDIHGSIICKELLNGCDLQSEAGQAEYWEQELFQNTCLKCVETAVKIIEEQKD